MNWKSPNAIARATMQYPLGTTRSVARRVMVPLGITLGDPARPTIPTRALVRGPGSARRSELAARPTVQTRGGKIITCDSIQTSSHPPYSLFCCPASDSDEPCVEI